MAVSTAWQLSRGAATSSTTGVWNVLCHMSRAEEVLKECDIHHTRSIKAAVNLSRKPGLDLCCDLLQHLQGLSRTCSFHIIIIRTSILLVPSLKLSFLWNVTRSNSRIIWMTFLFTLVLSCLTRDNIMHLLPLPLCGLYSIRAQNGYGQHGPCKIVLLTLVAPRGVTDLYLSWGIHTCIEHARTAHHETCGTE